MCKIALILMRYFASGSRDITAIAFARNTVNALSKQRKAFVWHCVNIAMLGACLAVSACTPCPYTSHETREMSFRDPAFAFHRSPEKISKIPPKASRSSIINFLNDQGLLSKEIQVDSIEWISHLNRWEIIICNKSGVANKFYVDAYGKHLIAGETYKTKPRCR